MVTRQFQMKRCEDCKEMFRFTAQEKEECDKNNEAYPTRCKICRVIKKEEVKNNGK